MALRYKLLTDDNLSSVVNKNYSKYSPEAKTLIARNILYSNPEFCIRLMPFLFWTRPGLLGGSDFHQVLIQPFETGWSDIEIPEEHELLPLTQNDFARYTPDYSSSVTNPYSMKNLFPEQAEDQTVYIVQEKIMSKQLEETAKKHGNKIIESTKKGGLKGATSALKTAFTLLKQEAEALASAAGLEFSYIGLFTLSNIKKFFSYLSPSTKIKIEVIKGEQYIKIYTKDAENSIKVILEGTEKEQKIIAMGFGQAGARRMLLKGGLISIVIVSLIDISKFIFSKTETMADLLTDFSADIPLAVASSLATAGIMWGMSYAIASVSALAGASVLIIPIAIAGGVIAIVLIEELAEFLVEKWTGYKYREIIKNYIKKHHLDDKVSRTLHDLASSYNQIHQTHSLIW